MIKIGDKVRVRPVSFGTGEKQLVDGKLGYVYPQRTGTVVYIHPQERFCVLEFQPQIQCRDPYRKQLKLRESFPLPLH